MGRLGLICAAVTALALPSTASAQEASLRADFQPLVDSTITIAEVTLPADGFLVVRLPKDNKLFYGKTLAVVPLEAGRHRDLEVKLSPGAKVDDTLGIVLHQDDTTVGTYEFEVGKEADKPFFNGPRPVLEVIGVIE